MAGRAEAQVTQLPSWAVTEFKDQKGANAFKYGQVAADAVSSELAKTNRYDVVPQDTVRRSIETLGLTSPPESLVNLSRIGQDVRANTIVEGQVLDYQVRAVSGGKQAIVVLRMVAYDVSSGLPVNGALDRGESTVRGGNVTNEALINDAIGQAAAVTVRTMIGQQLPSATVLNTTTRNALINQGTRSGFKTGDTVIITRGNLQVGTGRIGVIEPDQAEMSVERVILGLAPGDRVRAVFSPPALPVRGDVIKSDGGINVPRNTRRSGGSNNATLISALLVVGLIAVLLGNGNSSGTGATARTTAEATIDTDNTSAAVRISWAPNGFFKGSGTSGNGVARWQIYRSGVSQANPVLVVSNRTSAIDSSRQDNSEFPTQSLQLGQIGGTQCLASSPSNTTRVAPALLTVGTPYVYQVEAVYKVSSLDLPTPPGTTATANGGTTSAGTTSAGTTSAGTTSAGTTSAGTTSAGTTSAGTTSAGTTNAGQTSAGNTSAGSGSSTAGSTSGTTAGEQSCYFQSGRSSTGQATPLNRPTINSIGAFDTSRPEQQFTFTSNQGVGRITPEYVLEFSNDPTFPKQYTVRSETFFTTTQLINTSGGLFNKKGAGGVNLRTAPRIFYRVGVRNSTDRPGPVKDPASGKRYIYSISSANTFFERQTTTFPSS